MGLVITLVRHGETDWNAAGRIQGHEDIALNAVGLAQAEQLAPRLVREPITQVYCSDLLRTRQTVAPFLRMRAMPVTYDPALRERHFGRLQGMRRAEIEELDLEAFGELGRRDIHASFGNGESLQQFFDRCVGALSGIVASTQAEHVLIVCHGGVLDCLYRHARRQSLDSKRVAGLGNAAINQLTVLPDNAGFEVLVWNDTSHLSEARDETDRL